MMEVYPPFFTVIFFKKPLYFHMVRDIRDEKLVLELGKILREIQQHRIDGFVIGRKV